MNRPLLVSFAAATLLAGHLQAGTMYERFQQMETEVASLKAELTKLKREKAENTRMPAGVAVLNPKASDEDEAMNDALDEDEKADAEETDKEEAESEAPEDSEGLEARIAELEDQLSDIQDDISSLNSRTNGNALKFGVDFRTAVDNLHYKMAGKAFNPKTGAFDGDDTQGNDALLTNRLWLNMEWKATDNLSFTGQLAYNKAFGYRSGFGNGYAGFETFDWITNENAYDDVVRVRSAYFFYRDDTLFGADIPWTFSLGRRPSTNGALINLRDDDKPASPIGHTINVEFDGLSSKLGLSEITGVAGMYVKLCAGRGGTNANAKFFTIDPDQHTPSISAPYAAGELEHGNIPDIDLIGFIFVPYSDGQYTIESQYYYANNLIDANFDPNSGAFMGMEAVGGMHAFTAHLKIDGIGDGWSDYLDDTTFFVSGAWSMTNPDEKGQGMLGSTDSKTGSSYWVGLQVPSLITDYGRWGVEFNHGDKYWRSITYAEDTNIGSKVAARGNAFEVYMTEPLHEDMLSFQIRYTYIDYEYTGSNGFFGSNTGTPVNIEDMKDMAALSPQMAGMASMTVDTAQDIRAYIRYRF